MAYKQLKPGMNCWWEIKKGDGEVVTLQEKVMDGLWVLSSRGAACALEKFLAPLDLREDGVPCVDGVPVGGVLVGDEVYYINRWGEKRIGTIRKINGDELHCDWRSEDGSFPCNAYMEKSRYCLISRPKPEAAQEPPQEPDSGQSEGAGDAGLEMPPEIPDFGSVFDYIVSSDPHCDARLFRSEKKYYEKLHNWSRTTGRRAVETANKATRRVAELDAEVERLKDDLRKARLGDECKRSLLNAMTEDRDKMKAELARLQPEKPLLFRAGDYVRDREMNIEGPLEPNTKWGFQETHLLHIKNQGAALTYTQNGVREINPSSPVVLELITPAHEPERTVGLHDIVVKRKWAQDAAKYLNTQLEDQK